MDIRQLRYFISVAEHLNFTEAARHLYVAQSAVSHQIAHLEQRLGVKLFLRDKHSVHLTAAGQVLLKEATSIIASSDDAVQKTRQAASGVVGSLNIGLLAVPVINSLAESIRTFRRTYPDIDLNLNQYNAGVITDLLTHGNLDIGFTRLISVQNTPGLVWKSIYTDTISVVMRHDHPLADENSIDISRLANETFVSMNRQQSPGLFDLMVQLCINRGFSPKIISQPQHVETVLLLIETELGISILPRCFEIYAKPNLRFIDITGDDAHIDLLVAWNQANLNPSLPLFLEYLESIRARDCTQS